MKHLTRFIIAGSLLALLLIGRAAPPSQAQGLVMFIYPTVEGTLGDNGWYRSDVTVTFAMQNDWTPDPWANCGETVINQDTTGTTLICTGSGPDIGAFYGEVTVKVDTTPPTWLLGPILEANEGTTVVLDAAQFFSDATSGLDEASAMWDGDEAPIIFDIANPAIFEGIDNKAQGDPLPCFFVIVFDQAGNQTIAQLEVQINNVAPALDPIILSAETIPLGGSVEVSDKFIDAGILDTHTAVIDWGDGSTSSAAVTENGGEGFATDQHIYYTTGIYTIQFVVRDKDGGESTATATVTVLDGQATIGQVLIPGVTGLVEAGFINPGQGNALTAKLVGAQTKLAQGQINPAINKLNASLNQMNAFVKDDKNPDFNVAITGLINDIFNLKEALRR